MRFEARTVRKLRLTDDQRVVLDHVQVKGEDYSRRKLQQFCTVGSRLEGCRFDKSQIECAQFGSGGQLSEFVECSFDGARLEMGPGGVARYLRCSFCDVDIYNWLCFEVELIDCVFSGRIRKAIFNGSVRKEMRARLHREKNEFRGNDFSDTALVDVDFRTGIDLTCQKLPSSEDYLVLPDPMPMIARARAVVLGWRDFEHRHVALIMLKTMEDQVVQGQRQLFMRPGDHYAYSALPRTAVDNVFALLRG